MPPNVARIAPEEVKARLDRGENILFLDTRSPQAWADGTSKMPGAIRLLASEVGNHLRELPRDRTIVAYCT
jgi:superoxide dismutase, Fe-Mn family